MPYQRILNQMFTNLTSRVPSGGNRSFRFSILRSFVEAYHYLRPPKVPGFAYAWMELIGHRVFINAVMINENRNCWKNYASGVENEKKLILINLLPILCVNLARILTEFVVSLQIPISTSFYQFFSQITFSKCLIQTYKFLQALCAFIITIR